MERIEALIEANCDSTEASSQASVLRRAYEASCHLHAKAQNNGDCGLDYQEHILAVAEILTQLRLDTATVAAGLLHDVLSRHLTTAEELEQEHGQEVRNLVERATKVNQIIFPDDGQDQAENSRKMLLAVARDIRVVLLKLADRLHNLRRAQQFPPEARQALARETMAVYAPLANRMGISWLKSEMEDLAFAYLEPENYAQLSQKVKQRLAEDRQAYVAEVKEAIAAKMQEHHIDADVSGRSKHLYSIYRKLQQQDLELDQLYDLIAFRIIVDSVRECYAALGVIHANWKPVPGRFKDYIAMPKANMYQSLHTTVVGPQGKRMEVQIRTEEMHRIAEEGIAAHWAYKEGRKSRSSREDSRFRWLRQLLEWQQEMQDSRELASSAEVDLFPEEVYVFTPKGHVKELPCGACPIDFAYSIHTDIGHRCVGARVNGKLVSLKTQLQNGDMVEILTSANQTPKEDWLSVVKTSKARNKIRHWLKQIERERSLELGRELLDKELRKKGQTLNRYSGSEELKQAIQALGCETQDELLTTIGYGKITAGQVLQRLFPESSPKTASSAKFSKVLQKLRRKPEQAIRVQGLEDIMVRFANCCNPLPGDDIVGFISRGRGVTVHRSDCPHISQQDPQRRIAVSWDSHKPTQRAVGISVSCRDQQGILADISSAITSCDANIVSAQIITSNDHLGHNHFVIQVQDLQHLERVMRALRKVKGVQRVQRRDQQPQPEGQQ